MASQILSPRATDVHREPEAAEAAVLAAAEQVRRSWTKEERERRRELGQRRLGQLLALISGGRPRAAVA